jgi:hypothetical protein
VEASDVIFAESADPVDRLSAALAEARRLEAQQVASRETLTARLRAAMVDRVRVPRLRPRLVPHQRLRRRVP